MSTTNNERIRSLGVYTPGEHWYERIQAEIVRYMPACCQRERISVRVPPVTERDLHPDNLLWHQDGGGPEGVTRHMVLWADRQPTMLAVIRQSLAVDSIRGGHDKTEIHHEVEAYLAAGTAEFLQPAPYEVIWLDNFNVFHRMPPDTDLNRWFVSVRCSGQ